MPKKRLQNHHFNNLTDFNIGRFFAELREKAYAKLKNNNATALERSVGRMGLSLDGKNNGLVANAIAQNTENSEGIMLFDASVPGNPAIIQANLAHQALIDYFGLPFGLAAPEVIILDIYPQVGAASLEAVRLVCGELRAMGTDSLPNAAIKMLENKFWVANGDDFAVLSKVLAVDYQTLFRVEANFEQETQRFFGNIPTTETNNDRVRRMLERDIDTPVLVVLGLFTMNQFLHKVNASTEGCTEGMGPTLRSIKPFTRYDDSMFVFDFAMEMLLASGQGLASIAAPAELCHIQDAVGMRKRWVKGLDRVHVDVMADSMLYQLLKLPPHTVTGYGRGEDAIVLYRSDGQTPNRDAAIGSTPTPLKKIDTSYQVASPAAINKYSLIPPRVSAEYHSWTSISDIAGVEANNGLMEKRGGTLIDIDSEALERRIQAYLDCNLPWRSYVESGEGLTRAHSGFNPESVREHIQGQTPYSRMNIARYAFKPFDNRYCYYSPVTPLWNDPRPELARQRRPGNGFVVTRPAAAIEPEGVPFFFTDCLTDGDLLRGHAYCIPLCLYGDDGLRPRPNLSHAMLEYLRNLRLLKSNEPEQQAQLIWRHVLAIGYSPAYLTANAEALQKGWPRIPFPMPTTDGDKNAEAARARLLYSAALGGKITALLVPESDSPLSFMEEYADSYDEVAPLYSYGDGVRDAKPFVCDSIALDANWGYAKARRKRKDTDQEQWSGQEREQESGRNVMPGHGRLFRRNYNNEERRALEDLGLSMGLHAGAIYIALGYDTCDIYLDREVFWRNVPSNVWEYRVGGYPVLKKWLSYREHVILGRDLRRDEVQYFTGMVWRLTALRLLECELDRNFTRIRDHGGDPAKQRENRGKI